jgi:transcription initiation factor TFIIIB Brf1 subunit/transcription initiation factor TFIIB
MPESQGREPTVSEALEIWREAERASIRGTARRESAAMATEAAERAEDAARTTAQAAAAAMVAASEASRTADATAEAATKVLAAARDDGETSRLEEERALAAEVEAKAGHKAALARAEERYRTRADGEP